MTESSTLQRYTWENCLIEASALKLIRVGWAHTALRLSRQVNWTPKKTGRQPGLYWSNSLAAKSVGISVSTLYEHLKGLKLNGFVTVQSGNLVPRLPDNHEQVNQMFIDWVQQITQEYNSKNTRRNQEENSEIQIQSSEESETFSEDLPMRYDMKTH